MYVLIIEDTLSKAMTLEQFVLSCGHQPICVSSAGLACQAAAECPIDLVLLDIVLSGTDGYELAAQLRRQGMRAPIIAVTSLQDDPVKRQASGIDAYLHKPVSITDLKSLLKERQLAITRRPR